MPKLIISIDFDGVIHDCTKGYKPTEASGAPIPGALVAIQKLKDAGHKLFILTGRKDLQVVRCWVANHPVTADIPVTNIKTFAHLYIDDHGHAFRAWEQTMEHIDTMLTK